MPVGQARRRATWLSELRRAVLWHRRLLAAALAAGAVGSALTVLAPQPPTSVPVLAAARDLTAGTTLHAEDVAVVGFPPSAVPDGALDPQAPLTDRVLAVPVRRGEPLTDLRFVGSAMTSSLGDGLVATPVRISDPGVVALLRPGDIVDVVVAGQPGITQAAVARVAAARVRVISIPAADPDELFVGTGFNGGALVVLATSPETATQLAGAAVTGQLSVLIRPE